MTTTPTINCSTILNRVAAEVGLEPVEDPYARNEQHFRQMQYLLQTCGEELALAHPWEFLNSEHQFTTDDTTYPTGEYPLPTDFHYMIPQTGWNRSDNTPLGGPLDAQEWTCLLGSGTINSIYVSFRLADRMFKIYPAPPPDGLDINFEYQKSTWCYAPTEPTVGKDTITEGTDIVLFDRTLITRMLKLKWLESKGFDTTKAQDDFNQAFGFLTGKDKSGKILSIGGPHGKKLLTMANVSDTGYGS